MPSETELAGIARYEREEAAFTASGLALAHDELLSIGSMKRAIHESRDWTSNFRSSTIRASLASRLIQAVRSGRGHSKIEESSRMCCSLTRPYVPSLHAFDATCATRTLWTIPASALPALHPTSEVRRSNDGAPAAAEVASGRFPRGPRSAFGCSYRVQRWCPLLRPCTTSHHHGHRHRHRGHRA
jgi:hypothetical protein